MWLLYVSCGWVAGIFLGSKASLPAAAIFSGLLRGQHRTCEVRQSGVLIILSVGLLLWKEINGYKIKLIKPIKTRNLSQTRQLKQMSDTSEGFLTLVKLESEVKKATSMHKREL